MIATSSDVIAQHRTARGGPTDSVPMAMLRLPDGVSFDIRRTSGGILVTAEGPLDRTARVLLMRVLNDLVAGQGNSSVTLHAEELPALDGTGDPFEAVAVAAAAHGCRFAVRGGPWSLGHGGAA